MPRILPYEQQTRAPRSPVNTIDPGPGTGGALVAVGEAMQRVFEAKVASEVSNALSSLAQESGPLLESLKASAHRTRRASHQPPCSPSMPRCARFKVNCRPAMRRTSSVSVPSANAERLNCRRKRSKPRRASLLASLASRRLAIVLPWQPSTIRKGGRSGLGSTGLCSTRWVSNRRPALS